VWRFKHRDGATASVTPVGPLRVTNVEALIPTLLAGQAIGELPEFIAYDLIRSGRVQAILPDWSMALGGLFFVTPTTRARSAKVTVLSTFLTAHLAKPEWQMGPNDDER
jgi:DNA-binding transcriptional LysR family regulator